MKYKINGKVVTKRQWDAYYKKRQQTLGISMEEILQSKTAPGTMNTDRAFLQGTGSQSLTHGMGPVFAQRYYERARKAGISTSGKVYVSQLGTPDNPLAWVSGLDDVKKSCEIQGKGCDALGVKPVIKDPGPDIPLAEDIVQEEVAKRLMKNPDLAAKVMENPEKLNDLKGEVIDKHGSR